MTTITKLHLNGSDYDIGSEQNVKIFTLSSTSDLVNAQAAYDWYKNGGNPVIKFNSNGDREYYLARIETNFIRFSHMQAYSTGMNTYSLTLNLSGDTVTSVVEFKWIYEKVTSLPATPDADTIYFVTN